jgi:hypothetical protein
MDNSFRQQESETQQSNGFFVNLQLLVGGLLHWLAGLIQLTEEEQEDAGIFPDGIHDQ